MALTDDQEREKVAHTLVFASLNIILAQTWATARFAGRAALLFLTYNWKLTT